MKPNPEPSDDRCGIIGGLLVLALLAVCWLADK